jgi:hypothetical protein
MERGNPDRPYESTGGGGTATRQPDTWDHVLDAQAQFEDITRADFDYSARSSNNDTSDDAADRSPSGSIPAQRQDAARTEHAHAEVFELGTFREVLAIEKRAKEDPEFSLFMAAADLAPEEDVSEAYFVRAVARAKEFETRKAQKEEAAAKELEAIYQADRGLRSAVDLFATQQIGDTTKLLSATEKLKYAKGLQIALHDPSVAEQVHDLVQTIDEARHPKHVSTLTQLREETAHRRQAVKVHQPTRVEQALDQGAHVIDVTQRLAKKGMQAAKEVDVTKAAASTLVATALVGAAANGLTATSSLGGGRGAASVSVSGHAVSVSSLMPAKPGTPTELAMNAVVLESYSKEVTARAEALPEVSQTSEVAKTINLIDVSLSEKATTFADSTSNPNSKKAIIASEAIAHAELHHPGQAIPATDRAAILAAPQTPEIAKAAQGMVEILQSTDTANVLSPDEQKVIAAMYVHMATYASPEVKNVAVQAVTAAAEALPTDTPAPNAPVTPAPTTTAPDVKAPSPVAPATPGTDPLVPTPTPSPNTVAPAPNERVLHPETYKGKYVTTEQIATIEKFRPEYEKAAKAHGLPWELLASIHLRETNLSLVNPGNGQGLFQFVAEAGAYPAGPISPENFDQQLDHLAQRLADNYATRGPNRATLTPDAVNADRIKDILFSYNGRKDNYEAQAAALGFDPVNQGYEGSPYVMNLADDLRNSDKNPNWLQAGSDHGEDVKAGKQPGAWLMFNDIATASGLKVEASTSAAPHLVPKAPEQPPSDQIACAPGTRDIGMNQFWVSGKETMGRLCAIPGFKSSGESSDPKSKYYVTGANGEVIVAARASETWLKAFTDAKADGVDLSAISSYRPHQQQIDLCQADAYCKKGKAPGNNRNVAYPGTGEHEKGEAVDILDSNKGITANCTGLHEDHTGRCIAPDDKRWLWMLHNGADHNLAQYIGESWHWKLINGGLK